MLRNIPKFKELPPAEYPTSGFMIHAEWMSTKPGKIFSKIPIPGKWQEQTVHYPGTDFMEAYKWAQKEFPNAKIMIRNLTSQKKENE